MDRLSLLGKKFIFDNMRRLLFVMVVFFCVVGTVFADPTASIFVKDATEFQAIQKELDELKAGLGEPNPELEALWERANNIAQMNDRCAMISINEVLDEECSHFYAVELPEFETKYMEVTGELRLNFLSMGNTLAERTEQIKACAEALGGILVSKEQLLKLNGTVDLEPLNYDGAFDATYDFNLFFDSERMEQQRQMMKRWVSKCGDIVLRKSGDEYAPLFLQSVEQINDSLDRVKANIKIVMNSKSLGFYLDLNKPVSGAYYLNGVQLFSVNSLPMGRKYSHLVVNIPEKTVKLPLGANGKMQNFKGRVEFTSVYQEKDLVGRWSWNSAKNIASVAKVKGEVSETAVEGESAELPIDSAESKQNLASAVAESAIDSAWTKENTNNEASVSGRIHWIPIAISAAVAVGGGVMAAVFNSKAKSEREKKPKNAREYNEICDNIDNAQTMRSVGLGIAALGVVGMGVSFWF